MKLTVSSVLKCNSLTIIEAVTSLGKIKGVWKGKELPVVNNSYFFELDLPMIEKKKIKIIDFNTYSVEVSEDDVLFFGRIEDRDDVYYIRFSLDWLEMIELESTSLNIGDFVSFAVDYKNVNIYPYSGY